MPKFGPNERIMLIPEFDVYLSYAPEDKEKVSNLVSTLENNGLRVWWQHHHLKPKEAIALLQRQLNESRVQLVVWSKHSAGSGRVQAEARVGSVRGRLIATRIQDVLPPRDTAAVTYADLSDWIGGQEHRGIRKTFSSIWNLIGKGLEMAPPPIPRVVSAPLESEPVESQSGSSEEKPMNNLAEPEGSSDPSLPASKDSIENANSSSTEGSESASAALSEAEHSYEERFGDDSDSEEESYREPSEADLDEDAWQDAYDKNSKSGYALYLGKFPNGIYAEEAREKLAMKKRNTRVLVGAVVGFLAIYLIGYVVMVLVSAA